MSFTIEDGTGVPSANSYAAVAEFDAYHADRGNDVSALSTEQKQNLLIKATDYVDRRWGMQFKGYREFDCQTLLFPRLSLYDRDGREVTGIPALLKNAVFEYALKLNTVDLFPDLGDRTQQVVSLRKRVGPLETETRYSESTAATLAAVQPYPLADRYLSEYLLPSGGSDRA